MGVWAADQSVFELVEKVKNKHHKHLQEANVAVTIKDGKAFVRDRFNWGTTTKFAPAMKVHHSDDKRYDFLITLVSDAWDILTSDQREAWIDLRLSCCQVEYEAAIEEKDGKKKPLKDKWGRQVYTDVIKLDDDDNPKWKTISTSIDVISANISRYGLWCEDLMDLNSAIKNAELNIKTKVIIEEI